MKFIFLKHGCHFLFLLLVSIFSIDSFAQTNTTIDSLIQELEGTNDANKEILIDYQLGKHYFRANNLAQAAKYAELSYNGAKILEIDSTVENASNLWGIISAYQGKTDRAVRLLKESNRIAIKLKDSMGISATYSLLSNVYNQMLNDPTKAFSYIDSAERFYQKENLDKIIFGKIVKGAIFTNVSEYQYALEEYYSALDLAKGDTSMMVSLHVNIGAVFSAMGNNENSIKYYKRGLKLAPKTELSRGILYTNIGDYYFDKRNEDSAMLYINRARFIFEKNNNFTEKFYARIKTSQFLLEFDKKDSALVYFATIDTSDLNLKEKLIWWILSYELASPSISLNDFVHNFNQVKEALDDDSYLNAVEFLFQQYFKKGNTEKALEFKMLYADRKDSIMEKEKVAKGHAVQLKRIVSTKNKEILESKVSNEKLKYSVQIEEERKQKWKFTSALLILITLSTMFSLYVVIKRKRDKQKFNKKELAHEKMRREILVYKLESAKKAVNDKNTEIESLLLNISRDNIENGAAETMMANLKDRNWFIFLSEFELIYPHFFDSISEHMESSISKNERRLCALIKLGLSNKEMSEYVFVSQESIKKAKNRFFKKFQIQGTGQEISDMIRNS